jgi:serine-type D-Ala-D-Ala carboxypeptidase/endopeptidase
MNFRYLAKLGMISTVLVVNLSLKHPITAKEKINSLASEYANNPYNAGIAIGIIQNGKEEVICFGYKNKITHERIDASTIFEIGSITKIFTATILAGEVNKNTLSLNQKISNCFNFPVSKSCSEITLKQLATHSSGLPRLANNFWPSVTDRNNPYISYNDQKLKEYLSYALPVHQAGLRYEYSNYGFGLLGYYLTQQHNKTFIDLVSERICLPFGMSNTYVNLPIDKMHHLATGHSFGKAVKNWDFLDATAGQGALKSDMSDMMKFMWYGIYPDATYLKEDVELTQQIHFWDRHSNIKTGLGWHIGTFFGEKYLEHTGGTGGYRSFIGICPNSKTGVVILSNSNNEVDQLGLEILKQLKVNPL